MLPKRYGVLGAMLVLGGCVGSAWQNPEAAGSAGQERWPGGAAAAGRSERTVAAVPLPMRQVRLVVVHSDVSLQLSVKGKKIPLHSPEDFVLQSHRLEKKGELHRSEWVFVGYGLTVPALGWDSYRHQDVSGKTVVMLSGAPPIPDGTAVSSAAAFNHPLERGLGHWRSKLDNARRHGAAAAILVQAGPEGGALRHAAEAFDGVIAPAPGEAPDTLAVYGWVPENRLAAWLKRGGVRWDSLRRRAAAADFAPVPLPVLGDIQWNNRWRELEISIPQ